MLELDYTMQVNCVSVSECSCYPNCVSFTLLISEDYISLQENIVRALSLKTVPSDCLMWDLRPYIDDNVRHLAWEMCS
jgi:hypothetical protein